MYTNSDDKRTSKSGAWDVFLAGKEIDTVFYNRGSKITADEVRRSLINHDGYDPRITIDPAK